MILTRDYYPIYPRVAAPSPDPRGVSTETINRQVFQTFQHLLTGTWTVYREDKPSQYLKVGGILLLGRDVRQPGDQYLVSVRWTLYDEDMNMAGLHKEAPTHYSPTRGSARVSLSLGLQGYRPGDSGALGGIIQVNGLPMTPIRGDKVGIESTVDTPYQAARNAQELIDYYDGGYFKPIPGAAELRKDYYKTENPEEGYPEGGWDEGVGT